MTEYGNHRIKARTALMAGIPSLSTSALGLPYDPRACNCISAQRTLPSARRLPCDQVICVPHRARRGRRHASRSESIDIQASGAHCFHEPLQFRDGGRRVRAGRRAKAHDYCLPSHQGAWIAQLAVGIHARFFGYPIRVAWGLVTYVTFAPRYATDTMTSITRKGGYRRRRTCASRSRSARVDASRPFRAGSLGSWYLDGIGSRAAPVEDRRTAAFKLPGSGHRRAVGPRRLSALPGFHRSARRTLPVSLARCRD